MAVVILSVRRSRKGRTSSRIQAQLNSDVDLADHLGQPSEVRERVLRNRCLPRVEGMLNMDFPKGLFGLGGTTSHPRWFELDPEKGTLRYWKPQCQLQAPEQVLKLERLKEIDANEYQWIIALQFRDRKRVLRVKAGGSEDFLRWMAVLCRYYGKADVDVHEAAPRVPAVLIPASTQSTGTGSTSIWSARLSNDSEPESAREPDHCSKPESPISQREIETLAAAVRSARAMTPRTCSDTSSSFLEDFRRAREVMDGKPPAQEIISRV